MASPAERRVVVVDGSNLATEGRTKPSLRQLDEAVRAYAAEDPDAEIVVVVDASFEHRIDPSERQQLVDAELHGEIVSPPAGAIGRGDAFVLRIAERTGARVLSNDSFQEFHQQHPWLFDGGRLVGGKPVPGIGWIFTPRIPVRGPKSRQTPGKSKHGDEALSPPVKAAELAKAAKKAAATRIASALPGGATPKVGDVWTAIAGGRAAHEPMPEDGSASRGSGGKKARRGVAAGGGGETAKKGRAGQGETKKGTVSGEAPAKSAAGSAVKKPGSKEQSARKQAAKTEAAGKATGGKKGAGGKAAAKQAAPEQLAAKEALPDGTSGEKAAPEKAAAKKVPAKKAAPERAAAKKAAPKKAAAKKAAPEKAATKQAATKQAVTRKVVAKKAAPKRSAAQRAEAPSVSGTRVAMREDPVVREAIDEAMAEALMPAAASVDGKEGQKRSASGARTKKGKEEGKGKRRRRRSATPPPAVNEPLAFITFVATYPLQSEVEGEVVSFTSHGAMVDVPLPGGGQLHCYIPLTAMGDPPPTKARQVLSRGEHRRFVLVGLDPPRRVAELALPGVQAVAAALETTSAAT